MLNKKHYQEGTIEVQLLQLKHKISTFLPCCKETRTTSIMFCYNNTNMPLITR